MDCSGPQGIRPLARPMMKEEWPALLPRMRRLSPLGMLRVKRRSQAKPPSRFSAMMSMKAAAAIWMQALTVLLMLMAMPSAPTMPPITV